MVELVLDKSEVSFNLHPYIQCNKTPNILPLDGKLVENFMSKLAKKSCSLKI